MSVMVMGATLFTGCGDDDAKKQSSNGGGLLGQLATAPSVDMPEMDDDSDSNKTDKDEKEQDLTNIKAVIDEYKNNPRKSEETDEFNTSATMEPVIFHNEDNIVVAILGITYTDYRVEIDVVVQNGNDENKYIDLGNVGTRGAVNGIMVKDFWAYEEVEANSTKQFVLNYAYRYFDAYGIEEIATFALELGYYTEDDYVQKLYEFETSLAADYDSDKNTYMEAVKDGRFENELEVEIQFVNEETILASNDIKVNSQVYAITEHGEQYMYFEVENNTDEILDICFGDIRINDMYVERDEEGYIAVLPGTKGIYRLDITDLLACELWQVFGFDQLNSIAFNVFARDEDYQEVMSGEDLKVELSSEKVDFDLTGKEIYNEEGISILSKGLHEVKDGYSELYAWVLVVNNNGDCKLRMNTGDDEVVYVNGKELGEYSRNLTCESGEYLIVVINFYESEVTEAGIASIDDITNIEFTPSFSDAEEYINISKPTITETFE